MNDSELNGSSAASLDWLSPRERSKRWGTRFRLREWVANSLIIVPALYLIVVIAMAAALARVEGSTDLLNLRIDNDTARTLLSSISGGMIAFSGLVVSIAVLVIQFAAGQYSPRMVSGFRRDPLLKHSLGIFLAPAVFSLVALREIGRGGQQTAPSLTLGVDFALLAFALLSFCLLVGRLLDLLRPRKLVARFVKLGAHAATEVYPFRFGQAPPDGGREELGPARIERYQGSPAVLVALDRGRLVREARRADVVIELSVGVGAYLPYRAPIFHIHPRPGSLDVDLDELQRSLMVGDGRTITQDPAFAMRVMVDMAIKALSPAINDPTTALEALDGMETLLLALAWRDLDRGRIADAGGQVRLVVPNPGWDELLDLAVTELRTYGAGAPQVTRRMRAMFEDLIQHTPPERNAAIRAQIERFENSVRAAIADPVELDYSLTPDRLGVGTTRP